MDLNEAYMKVFDSSSINVMANAGIIQAIIPRKELGQGMQLQGVSGRDWQGNYVTVEDRSDVVLELLHGAPSNFNDDDDFDYSVKKLTRYTVSPNEAIEIYDLTEAVVFASHEDLLSFHEVVSAFYHGIQMVRGTSLHFTESDEFNLEMEKMQLVLETTEPMVRMIKTGRGFMGTSSLFSKVFRMAGVDTKNFDKSNLIASKRMRERYNSGQTFSYSSTL